MDAFVYQTHVKLINRAAFLRFFSTDGKQVIHTQATPIRRMLPTYKEMWPKAVGNSVVSLPSLVKPNWKNNRS